MSKISTAVILCAGNGARMSPFTNFYPKSFLPVKDKLALEIVVMEAVKSGAKNIVFVHNKGDEYVKSFAKWFNSEYGVGAIFDFCEQKGKNGSGGAVLACADIIKTPFFLAFADDLTKAQTPVFLQLAEIFYKTKKNVVGVRLVEKSLARNYGILKPTTFWGDVFEFFEIVEKPKIPFECNYANLGRYVLTPEIFDVLQDVSKEVNGEIYLTKAFEVLAKEKKILAYRFKGECYDIGTMENYLKTFIEY